MSVNVVVKCPLIVITFLTRKADDHRKFKNMSRILIVKAAEFSP